MNFDNSGEKPMLIEHPNAVPGAPSEGYGDTTGKRAANIPGGAGQADIVVDRDGAAKHRIEESFRTDGAAQRRGVRPRR